VNCNEPLDLVPADKLAPTLALASENVPSNILTTVKVSEFCKYCSAACEVKYWNLFEPLVTTSPNLFWKSVKDVTTVGIPAGPLSVGPMIAAPIISHSSR